MNTENESNPDQPVPEADETTVLPTPEATAEQAPDETQEPEPVSPPPAAEPPPGTVVVRKTGGALATLALLLALVACAGAGWLWWQEQQQVELPAESTDYAALITRQSQQQSAAMADQLDQLRAEVEQKLTSQQPSTVMADQLRAELDQKLIGQQQSSATADQLEQLRAELDQKLTSQQRGAAKADQLDQLRAELNQKLTDQQREIERLRAERSGVAQSLVNLEESSRRSDSAVERRLAQLETSIAAIAEVSADNTDDLVLAETEYLLRAAVERLQLFSDPAGAQRALALAAQQLESVDDPIYMTVRQTLAGHQQALKSLELPDRVALSGQLLALARDSIGWPLDARRSLSVSGSNLLVPTQDEEGWWPRLKSALSSVVVIHREKDAATALLTLEEERLLRENVRLQLQVAQLAAVRAEQSLFDSSMATVREWTNEYYDASQPAVVAALAQIDMLAKINLNPPLPEISGALRQLRKLRASGSLADQLGTEQ